MDPAAAEGGAGPDPITGSWPGTSASWHPGTPTHNPIPATLFLSNTNSTCAVHCAPTPYPPQHHHLLLLPPPPAPPCTGAPVEMSKPGECSWTMKIEPTKKLNFAPSPICCRRGCSKVMVLVHTGDGGTCGAGAGAPYRLTLSTRALVKLSQVQDVKQAAKSIQLSSVLWTSPSWLRNKARS